jgi:hypothetical protein
MGSNEKTRSRGNKGAKRQARATSSTAYTGTSTEK